jgi:acyl-CoA synthetase (NDP forming)
MFGLGGIFTEIIGDDNFRVAPLNKQDAVRQIRQKKSIKKLEGVRGMQPVDIEAMADILIAMGKIGLDDKNSKEIDINPIKIKAGKPYAVDALIVLDSDVNANEC